MDFSFICTEMLSGHPWACSPIFVPIVQLKLEAAKEFRLWIQDSSNYMDLFRLFRSFSFGRFLSLSSIIPFYRGVRRKTTVQSQKVCLRSGTFKFKWPNFVKARGFWPFRVCPYYRYFGREKLCLSPAVASRSFLCRRCWDRTSTHPPKQHEKCFSNRNRAFGEKGELLVGYFVSACVTAKAVWGEVSPLVGAYGNPVAAEEPLLAWKRGMHASIALVWFHESSWWLSGGVGLASQWSSRQEFQKLAKAKRAAVPSKLPSQLLAGGFPLNK